MDNKSPHKTKYMAIETTGRLRTSVDPAQCGKGDFQQLTNMRYTDAPGIKSIKGMTKINATPLANPKVRSAFHFMKDLPQESHVIAQGYNSALTSSVLYDSTTAIPNAGTYTQIFSESSGAGTGKFSLSPDSAFVYGNSVDTLIWGGTNTRCAGFVVCDDPLVPVASYDSTNAVNNYNGITSALINQRYVHIASTRKIQGVNFTVKQANTQTVTVAVKYWNGSAWVSVSGLVDNTSTGGETLAQTGEISFTSTVSTAAVRFFNNTIAYWYLFDFNGVDATTSISYCTVDAPIQQIQDLWDGTPRQFDHFYNWTNSSGKYDDYSTYVYQLDYVAGSSTTYVDYNSFPSANYFVVGWSQRMMGMMFYLIPGNVNTNTVTMAVSYWNGSSWTALSINDGTATGGVSFSKTGIVTWNPPVNSLEFQTAITSSDLIYYYKVSFNSALSSNGIYLDYVNGIPAQVTLDTYKFPSMFQNRLCLCNDINNNPNYILIGAANSNCVFNGTDSISLSFGDNKGITAAASFFSRFSNNFYENLLVCKADSVWVVDGIDPSSYKVYNVAHMYGCDAPQTFLGCDIGFSAPNQSTGVTRNVVIWQSSAAIVIWDGQTLYPIDFDIRDVFDPANTISVEPTMLNQSSAFYDQVNMEYHWLWASKGSSVLNMEYVFDLIRKKWYNINRTSGLRLQIGVNVMDTNNNKYTYGFIDTGYTERLENGTTFDGQNMTFIWWSGDIPLKGWMDETNVRSLKPIIKAKNVTSNKLTIDYYGDASNTATKSMTFTISNSNGRLIGINSPKITISPSAGNFIFHSFKSTMITNNELFGFEPIGIGIFYREIREDT